MKISKVLWSIPSVLTGITAFLLFFGGGLGSLFSVPVIILLNPWLFVAHLAGLIGGPFSFLSALGGLIVGHPWVPHFGTLDYIGNPIFFASIQFLFWRLLFFGFYGSRIDETEKKQLKHFLLIVFSVPIILILLSVRSASVSKQEFDARVLDNRQQTIEAKQRGAEILTLVSSGVADRNSCEQISPRVDDTFYRPPRKVACLFILAIAKKDTDICNDIGNFYYLSNVMACKDLVERRINNSLVWGSCYSLAAYNDLYSETNPTGSSSSDIDELRGSCNGYLALFFHDASVCNETIGSIDKARCLKIFSFVSQTK